MIEHRAGGPGWPRVFGEPTSLKTVVPVLSRRYGPKIPVHTTTEWQRPDDPLSISSSAQLRSVTKITPFEITVLMYWGFHCHAIKN